MFAITDVQHSASPSNRWDQEIYTKFPNLYPIYRAMRLDPSPCQQHYDRLVEARQCVERRLNARPLPKGFTWKLLDYNTPISVVIDREGREVFHFPGEPQDAFTVRLAMREFRPLPIALESLSAVLGESSAVVRNSPLVDGGLLTGVSWGKRTIYLVGELHNVSLFRQSRGACMRLAEEGKIAFFGEGYPRQNRAEQEIRRWYGLSEKTLLFGIDHSGWYVLMGLVQAMRGDENIPYVLQSVHYHLKWTKEGQKIWQGFGELFGHQRHQILRTAFTGVGFHDELPSDTRTRLAFLRNRDLISLGLMIMDQFPGVNLSRDERGCLERFFHNPSDHVLFQECECLVQDRRDFWFAKNMRDQIARLPDGLPVISFVGTYHLHGLLARLRRPCPDKMADLFKQRLLFCEQLHRGITRNFEREFRMVMTRASLRSPLAETRANDHLYRLLKKSFVCMEKLMACASRCTRLHALVRKIGLAIGRCVCFSRCRKTVRSV